MPCEVFRASFDCYGMSMLFFYHRMIRQHSVSVTILASLSTVASVVLPVSSPLPVFVPPLTHLHTLASHYSFPLKLFLNQSCPLPLYPFPPKHSFCPI